MALFARQLRTLIHKNLLIALVRHWISTPIRAFLLPVIFIAFLAYARNLFIPPSVFGIGSPTPVRSFTNALGAAGGGRNKLVLVNNGFTGGPIDQVIADLSQPAHTSGIDVEVLSQEQDLVTACKSSLRGTSFCIAAAVFFSSPSEGPDGRWNYTIRADGALETKIVVDSRNNDAEIYVLPFQHAIDMAIARQNSSAEQPSLPDDVLEYPYTSVTAEQRKRNIRIRYMSGIINILGVAFFIGMCGITYQLTGIIATEREGGIAQLLDCMMPNKARWQPQMARIIANHLAFDIMYAPGWVIIAIILKLGVFMQTSAGILVVFHILSGLALSSMSIFGASFFRKAQLSGIISVIVSLLLAVLAQVINKTGTGAVAILSILFPPMNYTFFILLLARFEKQDLGASLVKAAPENPSTLPGIAFWVFLVIQIIAFPILGAMVEKALWGTSSNSRVLNKASDSNVAVSIQEFTKEYRPNWFVAKFGRLFRSQQEAVLAVNNISFEASNGQIMVLLGANGSGKSTTLDAIAGLTKITAGSIHLNYDEASGGFGLCPQKNVMWDDLTIEEHVNIMNRVKCPGKVDPKSRLCDLISDCDIGHKIKARAKTLSGGQKRKLQLAMAFTGGSNICCIDEISSGVDPISRRKIWDILLSERGSRSIILTTHFLDEADLLADHIVLLSKGNVRAAGTSVELKHNMGSGYRVHVYKTPGQQPRLYEDTPYETLYDQTVYKLKDSVAASAFIDQLEHDGIDDYQVSGPTIEDVFLKVAEELKSDMSTLPSKLTPRKDGGKVEEVVVRPVSESSHNDSPNLVSGKRIGMLKQALALFQKRATVLRRNYLPYAAAFLIPVIAGGLVTLFLKNFQRFGCSLPELISVSDISSIVTQTNLSIVVGPRSAITASGLQKFSDSLFGGGGAGSGVANSTGLRQSLRFVDTLDEFNQYIHSNFSDVTPGGFFLGDGTAPPTFAWKGNGDISLATITQNFMDVMLTNVSISSQYQSFDLPLPTGAGKALQLIVYFGLACSVYPAFFALYPCIERIRNVRALHYSNGVRALPLWSAYTFFDFIIVLVNSAIVIIIFRAVSDVWFHLPYMFLILILYGLASTLESYIISLYARSQLATFAFAAAGQAVMFLLYFIAYLSILTYAPANKIDSLVNVAHFVIAAFSPIASLTRGLFVAMNIFSVDCRDREFATNPGSITLYGGPILYLIAQSIILFLALLWLDGGPLFRRLGSKPRELDMEEELHDKAPSDELTKVTSVSDGLQVIHLSKQFKKNLAVDDVTFGVPRGQVFALLGPNGAGKSTTISMIRGDIRPSRGSGDILIENISIAKNRAHARSYLGVCPQFDAMDTMTVREHLEFYAQIRGVPDANHNVQEVMKAVGLEPYATRMAGRLSGGNKRKLSLGIALMGNPSVLLLDEPSSGMDIASKRVMWKTLASVVPGRSLVLTTHSMEEADALANRAGIMAGRMLALGTTDYLRRHYGNGYHVHLVHSKAPHTPIEDMDKIREWVLKSFPGAEVENKTYHGQLRFSVPMDSVTPSTQTGAAGDVISNSGNRSVVSTLFSALENEKETLGFEYYSVSQTTLDQVFLSVVGKFQIEGEDVERRE